MVFRFEKEPFNLYLLKTVMFRARYDFSQCINLPSVGHVQLKITEIIEIVTFVKSAANFFLRERKCESGERILLGDNTGVWAVMLWPFRFHYVGVWISTGLTVLYKYSSQNLDLQYSRLA